MMMEKLVASLRIDKEYINFVNQIKAHIRRTQVRISITANRELIKFYWQIGKMILEKEKTAKWGDKLIEALAYDLKKSFPEIRGFSKTNLQHMRRFSQEYPDFEIGQTLSDQLTWSQHLALIQYVDTLAEREWYAQKTVEQGWGFRTLVENLKSHLIGRQGKQALKTTNFHDKLPSPQSTLAEEIIKDPYRFHFLTVGNDPLEAEIEAGLVANIRRFLLEMGRGFAFIGNQYPLKIDGQEYRIDLLMYHLKLHAYTVIEIKRGRLKPSDTGQLNFYLSAVDDLLKTEEDNPSIGLLLCEKKSRIVAEYALRRVESPIGISEFELTKTMPLAFKESLPTIEEIETELTADLLMKKESVQDSTTTN